jgi:serine/threonine-protein kinase
MSSAFSNKGGRRTLRIGKYEVQAYIATGGMGAVYKAVDVDLGRPVALKILQPELALKPKVLERFRREARSAARLNHENIVTVYEFAEVNGTYLLALEFVEGIDLYDYVSLHRKLAPDEARRVAIQAARALAHAYNQGIVHRDIKPSNFLLTQKDGQPHLKLTDFGLARAVGQDDLPDTKVRVQAGPAEFVVRLTTLGTTVGTVDYMSPEQARDSSAADVRSDIYSLGCTLYFMLAGEVLFPEGTPAEKILKHVEAPPPDVRRANAQVPEGLVVVLERMLAKNPADRYQTPQELLTDLETCESLRPALAPVTAVVPRKPPSGTEIDRPRPKPRSSDGGGTKRPPPSDAGWLWGAAALVALLITGVAALLIAGSHRPPDGDQSKQILATEPASKPPTDREKKPTPPTAVEAPPKLFPIGSSLPRLYQPLRPLDLDALKGEYEGPLAKLDTPLTGPVVYRVCRTPRGEPNTFRTLGEACAKAPAERLTIIEIHDSGPLFEPSLAALVNRNLVIRAGAGYRPLVAWDAAAGAGPGADSKPSGRFMALDRGSLALEDLDVVFKSVGGNPAEAPVLFDVKGGTLTAWKCSFSAAGNPERGVVLARLDTPSSPARCRLRRCYARGAGLTAVSVHGSDIEVLLDGCLLVGDRQPLVHVTARADDWATLRVVRSTLVAGRALLRVDRAEGATAAPHLLWRGWDSLLARGSRQTAGDLVVLGDGVQSDKMSWRAVNCLYAGWRYLLSGSGASIEGSALKEWDQRWTNPEGDRTVSQPWPQGSPLPLEQTPPITYQTPGTPVCFAATSHADALGCDVRVLPAGRTAWLKRTYEPFDLAPVALPDGTPPLVPAPADGLYHGERIDLGKVDLGNHLQKVLAGRKPAPRVVLYLYGAGPRPSSPIRVRGFDLVLCFAPSGPRLERPTLVAGTTAGRAGGPLIEVEDGGLEVIDGSLSVAGSRPAALPTHLVRVSGGDLRLVRCRLAGPLGPDTGRYEGLLDFQGAGEEADDEPRSCAISDCVLQSGKAILQLRGTGARVRLRNCVVVAGEDVLRFEFDPAASSRLSVQCSLEHNTVALRQSLLDLPDPAGTGAVALPVVVRAEANVILDRFTETPREASLLRVHGLAVARGALLWQGRGNAYDQRLHASVVPAEKADAALALPAWTQLWGTPGEQQPHLLDFPATARTTFSLEHPRADYLALPPELRNRLGPAVPGADLARLGLLRKQPGP